MTVTNGDFHYFIPIYFHYSTVSAPSLGECTDTDPSPWFMHRGMSKEWPGGWAAWAVHLEQLEGTHKERNGKQWAVPLFIPLYTLFPLFILLYTLFPMSVQVWDGCKFESSTAAVRIPIQVPCVTQIPGLNRKQGLSARNDQTSLCCYYHFSLFHFYSSYLFHYTHYCKNKNAIWVGIHSRNQANPFATTSTRDSSS